MDDKLLEIIAICGAAGLLLGVVLRTIFKETSKSFVKGAEGLSWWWFLIFCIFFLGLAFYSWKDGSTFGAIFFMLFAMFNIFVMFTKKK